MLDFLDPVIAEVHTYTGALVVIFLLCTAMAAGVTEIAIRVERGQRADTGRKKAWWWNLAMRALATFVGLAFAPIGRRLLLEIPRVAPADGSEALPLEQVVPSLFVACLTGFLTGFFLTISIWAMKKIIARFSKEAAEKIPDFAETRPMTLTGEEMAALTKPTSAQAEPADEGESGEDPK